MIFHEMKKFLMAQFENCFVFFDISGLTYLHTVMNFQTLQINQRSNNHATSFHPII